MHVIGTAGHVDHGKSSLIIALTGMNPDRLKEEQERLMTIDLGFAWMTLPRGEEIGIVDVPGHVDFISNMLAGVGGLEAVLLVVAADEGIMPQTREHLAILDILQIRHCIVALSKIDLVDDPAWLELVEMDIRKALQATTFKDVPILRVSSLTRKGVPELIFTLEQLLESQPPRPDLDRPRLPIDRVFSIAGFGTIVTGTLSDGKLYLGDEVEILPSGLHARIRGLQTHRNKLETAIPGSRVAVNLAGANVEQVLRGQVITHPGHYVSTRRLDAHFHLQADVSAPLHHHTEVKFYIGASETIAMLRLLGVETLYPGDTGWVQLEFRTPILAIRGDHFILRRPSPGETLGGGEIVEAYPEKRHKRFDDLVIKTLENIGQGLPSEILLQTCLTLGPILTNEAILHSHLDEHAAGIAVQELLGTGQLLLLDNVLMVASQWSSIKETVLAALTIYHKDHPLRHGIPREELKSRLKLPPRLFNLVLLRLASENILIESAKWVALPTHVVRFSPFQQVKVDKLMEQFASAPFTPPSAKECVAQVGEDVFFALLEFGDLVAVSEEVAFRKDDYETMVAKIRIAIHEKGQVSLADVRDFFNTSRRYIQPLLEHLDSLGITVRTGDFRRLKNQNG